MQASWAIILLGIAAVWSVNGRPTVGAALAIGVATYEWAIVSVYRRRRWAWFSCFVPSIISLVLAGPGVIYNLWRASQQDPLFSNSPGTLIVVLIDAFVLVIPPILILLRLAAVRAQSAQ